MIGHRDLAELWGLASLGLHPRIMHDVWGPRALRRFGRVLGGLPIAPDCEGWCMVDPDYARPRDWQLIIAARAGLPCHPAAVPGVEMPGAEASSCMGLPTPKGWRTVRAFEALHGTEIVDLVAVVPEWPGEPLRRALGRAVALGDALGREIEEEPPDAGEGAGPLPISPDLRHWLAHVARGSVLPLGDPAERRDYLRGLACGLIAANAVHAAELKRAMKREPVPPPPIPDVWIDKPELDVEAA